MMGTAKTSLVLALFAVCQFAFACACTPAVMWCSHESNHDAANRTALLEQNPQQRSEELEKRLLQNNTVHIIEVDELCSEDLQNNKVLPNIINGSEMIYLSCFLQYSHVVRSVSQKIYNLKTKDINDDHMMNMILKNMSSNGSNNNDSNCIAIAAKQCRYSNTERIKREVLAENADNSTEFKIKTDDVLLYSAKPLLFKASNKSEVELTQLKVTGALSRKENKDKESSVILAIKFADVENNISSLTLEFFFLKSVGYYSLNHVDYEINNKGGKVDTLFTKRDISFPFGFSYHCSPKTVFANGTTYLSIMDMQVQVDHKNATFNDAYDCVGFTSIPIWTGIFVTAILGLIMIWALIMIMDIRTMDRFDDPKGKTITISSAE